MTTDGDIKVLQAEIRYLEQALEKSDLDNDFLREELRHRRDTDRDLGKVMEAFLLNAQTNHMQQ